MNARLLGIRRIVGDDALDPEEGFDAVILIEVGDSVESYVVRVRTSPVISMEPPSSLLDVLRPFPRASSKIAGSISAWVRERAVHFPVILGEIDINTVYA